MPLEPGAHLGPYEIGAPLGAGGMGEVYRARDTRLNRRVAIKVLPQHLMATEEARTRFEREARAIASINHPNVCTIHDIGREGETSYLVLELVEGESLRDRLATGRLSLDQVLTMGIEIADALDSAHAKGIIHRDLKPGNIMISSRGHTKVMDFGLATGTRASNPGPESDATLTALSGALTSSGSTLGTVAYMSPEQARGERLDVRSDLFSLGSVLYEMATGARTFPGSTDAVVFDRILNKLPTPIHELRPDFPAEFERMVGKALEKERDFRYQTAAELRADLKRLKRDVDSGRLKADGQGPLPTGSEATVPAAQHARRRAWLVTGGAIVLLAGLMWTTWSVVRRIPTRGGEPRLTQQQVPKTALQYQGGMISPDGRLLALNLQGDLAVSTVGTNDIRVVERAADTGRRCLHVSWHSDGVRLVSAESDSLINVTVALIDVATGRREVIARLGRLSQQEADFVYVALSPDGRLLAVGRRFSDSDELYRELALVDLTTHQERPLVRVRQGIGILTPAWSPSGSRVAYVVKSGQPSGSALETCDLAGNRTTVIEDPEGLLLPRGYNYPTVTWAPDGRIIYLWREKSYPGLEGSLRSLRIDPRSDLPAGKPALLYRLPGAMPHTPSVAADGSKLAFAAMRAAGRIRFLPLRSGEAEIPIPPEAAEHVSSPLWSRDGKQLYVRESRVGNQDVSRLELKTGRLEPLLATEAEETPLSLTPDGSELLCRQGKKLVAVSPTGGDPRVLVDSLGGTLCCPSSEGGDCLVVERRGSTIVVRDLSPASGLGAERFRFALGEGDAVRPPVAALSPDGKQLVVFRSDRPSGVILDASIGRPLRRIDLPSGLLLQSIVWSSDGRELIAAGMAGVAPYWVGRLASDRVQVLWRSEVEWAFQPAVAPNGGTIAFSTREFRSEMWTLEGF